MPWLVGVIADAADLRWGLAVAAATPLLMWDPAPPQEHSKHVFACLHALRYRLPCVLYLKKHKQCVAAPAIAIELAEDCDSRPMSATHHRSRAARSTLTPATQASRGAPGVCVSSALRTQSQLLACTRLQRVAGARPHAMAIATCKWAVS